MKKQFLAVSALALAVMSGSALAAPQDVQFVGTVTDVTCDIKPEVNGTTGNYVQLGSVTKKTGATNDSDKGAVIPFALKPAAGTSCSLTGKNTVSVTWIGGFDGDGLTAQSGVAKDAKAVIKSTNAKQNATITNAKTTVDFDSSNLTGTSGLEFSAQLHGGDTVGDYISSAAFLVQYK